MNLTWDRTLGRINRNLIRADQRIRRKNELVPLVICAMIRDEARYLPEWIKFHLAEGVSHIYLYDDESSDKPEVSVRPWIRSGQVSLLRAEGRTQEETYQNFLTRHKGERLWIAYIDIDEFLHPTHAPSLPAMLAQFDGHAAVFVFWKLFGAGKRKDTSNRGVVEDCVRGLDVPASREELIRQMRLWRETAKGDMLTGRPIQGKSIIRADRVSEMHVHFPTAYQGDMVDVNHHVLSPTVLTSESLEEGYLPPYSGLLIHHYWSRSENSLRLKHNKPGAASVTRQNPDLKKASLPTSLEWNEKITRRRDDSLAKRVRQRSFPYIFVIGFNKTATRALAAFFSENGLPAVHWDQNRLVAKMLDNLGQGQKIMSGYDHQFRVFTDLILSSDEKFAEGNQYFREMDRDYPNSLFILNNRATEDWIRSRELHNHGVFLQRQLGVLGTTDVDVARELWREQKHAHESAVRKYFEGNNRFLEIDIDSPEVPRQISRFLGLNLNQNLWRVIGKTEKPVEQDS